MPTLFPGPLPSLLPSPLPSARLRPPRGAGRLALLLLLGASAPAAPAAAESAQNGNAVAIESLKLSHEGGVAPKRARPVIGEAARQAARPAAPIRSGISPPRAQTAGDGAARKGVLRGIGKAVGGVSARQRRHFDGRMLPARDLSR